MPADATPTKPVEETEAQPKAHIDEAQAEPEPQAPKVLTGDEKPEPEETIDDSELDIMQPPKPPGDLPRGKPTPSISGRPGGGGSARPPPPRPH